MNQFWLNFCAANIWNELNPCWQTETLKNKKLNKLFLNSIDTNAGFSIVIFKLSKIIHRFLYLNSYLLLLEYILYKCSELQTQWLLNDK